MSAQRHPRATPGDPLERLRKVLQLEQAKGYADTAVMGGLDRFLRTLLERDGPPADSPVVRAIRSLPAGGYRRLTALARRRWLEQTLAAALGRPAPKRQPAARPRSTRPTETRPQRLSNSLALVRSR